MDSSGVKLLKNTSKMGIKWGKTHKKDLRRVI